MRLFANLTGLFCFVLFSFVFVLFCYFLVVVVVGCCCFVFVWLVFFGGVVFLFFVLFLFLFCFCFVFLPCFESSHTGNHISFPCMVDAGWVFVAGIQPPRICMARYFGSLRWNACTIESRPRFPPISKRVEGGEVGTHLYSKVNFPSTKRLREESNPQCCITQDSKPNPLDIMSHIMGPE